MSNKPVIAPRSVREAFGPYARLELHEPPSRWRTLGRNVAGAVLSFAAAVLLGAAFGWLLTIWPRLAA